MNFVKNILLPLSILLSSCAVENNDVAGATDIETGAAIAGVIYSPDGSVESGTTVTLIPDGYDPTSDSATLLRKSVVTNDEGEYSFNHLETGTYSIEVINPQSKTGLYKSSISITDSTNIHSIDTLTNNGTVVISLPKNTSTDGMVYIKNSTRIGTVLLSEDSIPTVLIENVPTGFYPEFYYAPTGIQADELLTLDTIVVESSDTNYVKILDSETPSSSSLLSSASLSSSSSLSSSTALISSSLTAESSSAENVSSSLAPLSSSSISSSSSIASSSSIVPINSVLNFKGGLEHVAIKNNINHNWPDSGITLETWVYWYSLDPPDSIVHLIHLSDGVGDNYTVAFGARNLGGNYYNLRYAVTNTEAYVEDPPWIMTEAPGVFTMREWIHVAATVTTDGLISLYANGELIHTDKRDHSANPDQVDRSINYLGKSTSSRDGIFHGIMDNTRIWNSTRTAEEIKADMYHSTDQLINSERLVLSYDFFYDPQQPLNIQDASGNNYNGTLTEMTGKHGTDDSEDNWLGPVHFENELINQN